MTRSREIRNGRRVGNSVQSGTAMTHIARQFEWKASRLPPSARLIRPAEAATPQFFGESRRTGSSKPRPRSSGRGKRADKVAGQAAESAPTGGSFSCSDLDEGGRPATIGIGANVVGYARYVDPFSVAPGHTGGMIGMVHLRPYGASSAFGRRAPPAVVRRTRWNRKLWRLLAITSRSAAR